MDCKSTMYVELQALEELIEEGFEPPCDIYLEYAINEETGGDGAASAMRYLKEKGIIIPSFAAAPRRAVFPSCRRTRPLTAPFPRRQRPNAVFMRSCVR